MSKQQHCQKVLNLRPDCLEDPTRYDVACLEAMMLWPDDESWRTRALETSFIEFNRPYLDVFPAEILRDYSKRAADALPVTTFQEEVKKERFLRGVLVGGVLHGVIGALREDPDGATKGAIIDKCIEVAQRPKNGKRPSWRISSSTFNNEIWPQFKSVAHFWAAYFAWCYYLKGSEYYFPKGNFPCRCSDLREFLSDAEAYRISGEAARTKQSRTPVLCAGHAVVLPDCLGIEPSNFEFTFPQG